MRRDDQNLLKTSSDTALKSSLCTPAGLKKKKLPVAVPGGRPLTVVDLFSGCGGLSFGALQASIAAGRDFKVAIAIDNNIRALEIYRQNLAKFLHATSAQDISDFVDTQAVGASPSKKEKDAWATTPPVDLIIAGPPCQGHSDLNNSSRRSDPRNLLYLAPSRVAACIKPKVVLIENVPTVVRSKENVVEKSHALLSRLGYYVAEITLDLTRLGVPQSRTRHVQIASVRPLDAFIQDIERLPKRVVGCLAYISDLADEASSDGPAFSKITKSSAENIERIRYLFQNDLYDLPNKLRPACHRDREHSYVSMYGRLDPDKPAQTITSGFGSMGQGRFVHPTRQRTITAHEAARLQGFPDSFNFDGCEHITALREMIGNAVPPTMAEVLVRLLISHGHL